MRRDWRSGRLVRRLRQLVEDKVTRTSVRMVALGS